MSLGCFGAVFFFNVVPERSPWRSPSCFSCLWSLFSSQFLSGALAQLRSDPAAILDASSLRSDFEGVVSGSCSCPSCRRNDHVYDALPSRYHWDISSPCFYWGFSGNHRLKPPGGKSLSAVTRVCRACERTSRGGGEWLTSFLLCVCSHRAVLLLLFRVHECLLVFPG